MDDQILVKQARALPDSNTNLKPFFDSPAALQIRVNALAEAGLFSPKKAIYILQNTNTSGLIFPHEIAGQVFVQLPNERLSEDEKLEYISEFFEESKNEIAMLAALALLDSEGYRTILMVTDQPNANRSTLEKFSFITKHLNPLTFIANANWDRWLERVSEICAMTISSHDQDFFPEFLARTEQFLKDTFELLEESEKEALGIKLSHALSRHFRGGNEDEITKVIEIATRFSVPEPAKNIRWQVLQAQFSEEALREFALLFDDEDQIGFAKFVTLSLISDPESRSNGYLGFTLAKILESQEINFATKEALINELDTIHFHNLANTPEQKLLSQNIDATVRGLIVALVKTDTYPGGNAKYKHVDVDPKIQALIISRFKEHFMQDLIDHQFVSHEKGIELLAQWLGADRGVIDELTNSSNGIELLASLRENRTGIPAAKTLLANQKTGFQSDAGQAWGSRS